MHFPFSVECPISAEIILFRVSSKWTCLYQNTCTRIMEVILVRVSPKWIWYRMRMKKTVVCVGRKFFLSD